jgi:hypothetical protein
MLPRIPTTVVISPLVQIPSSETPTSICLLRIEADLAEFDGEILRGDAMDEMASPSQRPAGTMIAMSTNLLTSENVWITKSVTRGNSCRVVLCHAYNLVLYVQLKRETRCMRGDCGRPALNCVSILGNILQKTDRWCHPAERSVPWSPIPIYCKAPGDLRPRWSQCWYEIRIEYPSVQSLTV